VAITIEAGREHIDGGRWERQPDHREHAGREQRRGQHLAKEATGAGLALRLPDAQPQRHESGVERALGQQSPEEIGGLQHREERIGEDAGAEHRCDAHVANES
jgi:hypothetical protein